MTESTNTVKQKNNPNKGNRFVVLLPNSTVFSLFRNLLLAGKRGKFMHWAGKRDGPDLDFLRKNILKIVGTGKIHLDRLSFPGLP